MQVNGNQKRNQKQSTSTLTFYDWEINSTTVLRVTAPSTLLETPTKVSDADPKNKSKQMRYNT